MKRKFSFIGFLMSLLIMSGGTQFVAANSAVTLPLPQSTATVLPVLTLEDESYDKLQLLTEVSTEAPEISMKNIEPRTTLTQLELVSGNTKKAGQEVWAFLVNDRQEVYALGEAETGEDLQFNILVRPLPETMTGQLYLVTTLISDLRLSLGLPTSMSVVPFYRVPAIAAADQPAQPPLAILLNEVQFFENNQPLKTFQTRFLEVYTTNEAPLTIRVNGEVYGHDQRNIRLYSVLLPAFEQKQQSFSSETGAFSFEETVTNLEKDQDIHLLILASEAEANVLNPGLETASTQQVISFRLKDEKDFPSSFGIFWKANRNAVTLVMLIILVISLIIIGKTFAHQSRWAKVLSLILLFTEGLFISYCLLISTLTMFFHQGLLQIPGQELVILKNSGAATMYPTLVRQNEDLELVPGLSTSWSNISPHIWEFVLRPDTPADSVLQQIQQKIRNNSSDRPYLASLKNIVSVNPSKLQFVTQYPDPLLPQKLSKVPFDLQAVGSSSAQEYLLLEEFPNATRMAKNEQYYELPFLKNTPQYRTVIRSENEQGLKDLISSQKIDVFDEPATTLWPALLQNGYQIMPKINTESLVLMLDRNSYFLKEPEIVTALTKILQSPRILQTSYFQYGQLANQFAPPGVNGYDPQLKLEIDPREPMDILNSGLRKRGESAMTLTFQYPSSERTVAKVIQQELERAGITIIVSEVPAQDYETILQQKNADLSLFPLDFDLGDAGPFLDALIDSESPFNKYYANAVADDLIQRSRIELNSVKRLQMLQQVINIITKETPAGVPLLFKKSFIAQKQPAELNWWERWLQKQILGWD